MTLQELLLLKKIVKANPWTREDYLKCIEILEREIQEKNKERN